MALSTLPWFLLTALLLASCGGSSDEPAAQAPGAAGSAGTAGSAGSSGEPPTEEGAYDPEPIGGARPTKIYVPKGYVKGEPRPLVVLLHGYGASGALQELLFQLAPEADRRGFLYIHPDGIPDKGGQRFWNATEACCDFGVERADDSAYLLGLVDEVAARYPVDPGRVYFTGHSNGSFMSLRLACDHADRVAAVVSLAGAMPVDVAACKPSRPVAVLHAHGDADEDIKYEGGGFSGGGTYPGARATVEAWAALNGCSLDADTSPPPLDLEGGVPGAETTVARYAKGCQPGGHAELWTLQGGPHIPNLTPKWASATVDFLYAHARSGD